MTRKGDQGDHLYRARSGDTNGHTSDVCAIETYLTITGQLIIKPPLVVEIIRDMRILRRKFENNKSRKNFETKN